VTELARPDRRAFYGVAAASLVVFAVLEAFTVLAVLLGGATRVLALWVLALLGTVVLVVRYRWQAVAGLSVGLVGGFVLACLAILVASRVS
jgi:hypothetical protein